MAKSKKPKVNTKKVSTVMGEWKSGRLHGGKNGPIVSNRKQAIAIALSEGRKAAKAKKKKK
jgi:hypothetical protein